MEWLRKMSKDKANLHDEPTEPIPELDAIPTVTLPPQPPYPPAQGVPQVPYPPYPRGPEGIYPPGGYQQYPQNPANPAPQAGIQRGTQPGLASRQGKSRSAVPILIGLCFVCLQFLLLLRFVLKLLGITTDQGWVGGIYGISDIFVVPFQLLWQLVSLHTPAQIEVYTLLAVIGYGIISRVVVHCLKVVIIPRLSQNNP